MTTVFTKSAYLAEFDQQLKAVRDSVKGAPFVKKAAELYLPNPSNVLLSDITEQSKKDAFIAAYEKYLKEAEFDDYTGLTERVMVGKLDFNSADIEVPERLEYLLKSSDGDGLTYKGLLENCAQNVLAAKWHVVIADYKGLTGLDLSSASIADVEAANPKVTFKEYPRESVYFASYNVVNNTKQLSFLVLHECGLEVDQDTMIETEVESILILGLDENGNYYQRKKTINSGEETSDTGIIPVTVNGQPIKFIPAFICSDEELTAGDLPQELGFLSAISDVCMARYNVDAKFKAALSKFVPSIFISGLTADTWEETKKINGSNVLNMNGVNVLAGNDEGVAPKVEVVSASGHLIDFHEYNEESLEKLRSMGASVPSDSNNKTATEAKIDSGQQNAVLIPIVGNFERMTKMLFSYAAMFEGLVNPDSISGYEDQINIMLNSEFTKVKGTPEELNAIVNLYVTGLRTKEQVVRMSHKLGWDTKEVEEVINELNQEPEL